MPGATYTPQGYNVPPIATLSNEARLQALEARAVFPGISNVAPQPEATAANAGAMGLTSDASHQHPRLTSSTQHTTGANGEVTCNFTQAFDAPPRIPQPVYDLPADGMPVSFARKAWVQDANGKYIAVTLKAFKMQLLPSNLTLLSALVSFNVTAGNASGVTFDLVAIKASTAST